jgi:hypothetical protein
MRRELLIPYALDLERDVRISADDIAVIMSDPRSTIRLQATASSDTKSRKALRFGCPACGQKLYPHAPTTKNGRHYWTHLPGGADECPLERKRKLTPDQINARIFRGRQEGDAHKDLVRLLAELAERDASVEGVELGAYEAPDDAMRSEFPFGRFPDLKFTCNGNRVVLEAQLATITLHGINGRRAFYDRSGACLLWVMRNFDPRVPMRASVRDIVADQSGCLFSLDRDLIIMSRDDGVFRLRTWSFVGEERDEPWEAGVVTIAEAAAMARPVRWSDEFKRRWIEAYKGASYVDLGRPDPFAMLAELAKKAGLPPFELDTQGECMLALVRLMISLEAGFVAGSGHPKLISLANSFDVNGGHRAVSLVRKAVERWQPELLAQPSMIRALARAEAKLKSTGDLKWGRRSPIGLMRDALFPDWDLGKPERQQSGD